MDHKKCIPPLIIHKVDNATGAGLAGATFELLSCDGAVESKTTDASGFIIFHGSPCNKYLLREVLSPAGYEPNETVYSIFIDGCGNIFVDGQVSCRLTIGNTAVGTAAFQVTKENVVNRQPLAGAVYTLFSGTQEIGSTVSTETGAILFSGLGPGIYELVETTPPPGFQQNMDRYLVAVSESGLVTINGQPANGFVLFDIPLGVLTFLKRNSSTSLPISGVEFALSQNGSTIATAVSDQNGLVDFGAVLPGAYTLTETSGPAGYVSNPAVYNVVVNQDGSITVNGIALDDFEVLDVPAPGFFFTKYDFETGQPVAGGIFGLFAGDVLLQTSISNGIGFVGFGNLTPGSYFLQETESAPGYLPDSTVYNVVVADDGSVTIDGQPFDTFSIANTAVAASFTTSKVNAATGTPLAGAEFTLYAGTQVIGTAVSDASGAVSFSGLAPGVYLLEETLAPVGFQPNKEQIPVRVSPNGDVTIYGFPAEDYLLFNVPLLRLIFQKVDAATNVPLTGVSFQLSQGGTVIANAISDAEGFVDFGLLPPGNYEMVETSIPPGYLPNPTQYQVNVGSTGQITINGIALSNFRVENVATPGFFFLKTDGDTGSPLPGAVFELIQNGTVLETATSNASGFVSFSSLNPGTYSLTETEAPVGYVPNPAEYTVVVAGDGSITVDGMPAADFSVTDKPLLPSPEPGINTITENDSIIFGSGIPGCTVTVEFPTGIIATTVVESSGNWFLLVPPGAALFAGDEVRAYQTCINHLPSGVVSTIVQPLLRFSVLYDAAGGIGFYIDSNLPFGSMYIVKSPAEVGIFRPGYTFLSWNTNIDGTGLSYTPGEIFFINSDVVLYARWLAS